MSFAYIRAADTAEAVALLGEEGSWLLAGGTDLLPKIRRGLVRPRLALIAARDLRAAREAGNLFRVRCQPLPAVFEVEEALAQGGAPNPPRLGSLSNRLSGRALR